MEGTKNNLLRKTPELRVKQWIDKNGKEIRPIKLLNFEGKYRIIYCFQHWCQGCHSVGFPSLKQLVEAFKENDQVMFFAIQTVFEGIDINTYDKILEVQNKYQLKIPFAHDKGIRTSTVMEDYKTGGTPWFIFINQNGEIEYADFHINIEGAIKYLKSKL